MLIAMSQFLKERGFFPWHYRWVATDIDQKCFHMTYIQTTLLMIPAGVTWGNTLSLEEHRSEWNLPAVLHRPRDREESVDGPVKVAEDCESIDVGQVQLELF